MAGVTYKCPSCGAYLVFNPDTQRWSCDFCGADFDEKTLLDKAETYQQEAEHGEHQGEETADGTQVVYHCPSCGSEIMTDETTVATNCYYCHNPVVLQGKLTADMKPELMLPFTIGKDAAVEAFMKWVKGKRYVPKGFFARDQVTQMQGVYYPHFVTDCDMDASYDGEGRDSTISETRDYIVTTTKHYAFHRRGDIRFRGVMRPALQSTNRKLSDGIHPFPLDDLKPFSGAYLTGFLAERRDLTAEQATADVEAELDRYIRPLLDDTVSYQSSNGTAKGTIKSKKSKYVMLPTWVLTYKGKEKDPYYYAMNGRTGEVCGKLPVDKGKLAGTCILVGAAVTALMCVISYFFF